jgi:hypothetical protein
MSNWGRCEQQRGAFVRLHVVLMVDPAIHCPQVSWPAQGGPQVIQHGG